jgi:hypothetical protein
MAATYITKAELRTILGIGTLYTDAVVEEVCQAAEDLIKSFLWFNNVPVSGHQVATTNVATLTTPIPHGFNVGQTIVVTGCAAHYNGSHTITGVTPFTLTYAINNQPKEDFHLIRPYGKIQGAFHADDYSTVPAVREASATVAVTIWQSRQAPGSAVATIDGYLPSPFTLGNALLGKVRGILAPYLAPSGMAG